MLPGDPTVLLLSEQCHFGRLNNNNKSYSDTTELRKLFHFHHRLWLNDTKYDTSVGCYNGWFVSMMAAMTALHNLAKSRYPAVSLHWNKDTHVVFHVRVSNLECTSSLLLLLLGFLLLLDRSSRHRARFEILWRSVVVSYSTHVLQEAWQRRRSQRCVRPTRRR